LLNTQGINKPAYYSYKFLNELGKSELQNSDENSWICKDDKGSVQILLWDFTYTLPQDSINNQEYYIRDLPALPKGKVQINLSGLAKGKYQLEIYKVGYKVNDAYADYLALKRPAQLTKAQVEQIKKQNDGSPFMVEDVKIKNKQTFVKELDMRENDVYLLKIIKK